MSEYIEEYTDDQLQSRYLAQETELVIEYVQPMRTRNVSPRTRPLQSSNTSPRNYNYLLFEYLRLSEAYQKLLDLKAKGVLDDKAIMEIMTQKVFLEDNIDKIIGKTGVVVVCNKQLFFGPTLDDAVREARNTVGHKLYYSETIDFIDYPSPFS